MLKLLGDLVTGWFNHLGYFGIVLAMALESCLIPLPSEIVMPVAGASITAAVAVHVTAHFSLIGVSLAGAIGCVIGSAVASGSGRREGDRSSSTMGATSWSRAMISISPIAGSSSMAMASRSSRV